MLSIGETVEFLENERLSVCKERACLALFRIAMFSSSFFLIYQLNKSIEKKKKQDRKEKQNGQMFNSLLMRFVRSHHRQDHPNKDEHHFQQNQSLLDTNIQP